MPLKPLMSYILAKRKQVMRENAYRYDMLWAMGSGMTFKDYPRWHDVVSPSKEKPVEAGGRLTKEMMKQHIARLK